MNSFPASLLNLEQIFLKPFHQKLSSIKEDPNKESQAYNAFSFKLNEKLCLYRTAKTTGTRPGQFVTIWKRPKEKIEPFDTKDSISYVIIATEDPLGKEKGFFIFSNAVLIEKKIISNTLKNRKGKLAFRVFPPWSENFVVDGAIKTQNMSLSAKKSQNWQLESYFPAKKEYGKNPFEFS